MSDDNDSVNHPNHYKKHPSGIECIQVTEHMGFNIGNAIKYLWRHEYKGGLEDLKKARWYIEREIQKHIKPLSKTIQENFKDLNEEGIE